jgi:4-aminobutyrate aminotransferase-like enzyme
MTTAKKRVAQEPQDLPKIDGIHASEGQEESENVVSTPASEADKITLDEYLKRHRVNPGLVASFVYEANANQGGLVPQTEEDWAKQLEAQSNRTYS